MRLLSLAPPFRGSLHAGGGREGGRRGRSREGGWRTEGGDAGGAAEEGRTCCRGGSSRGPQSAGQVYHSQTPPTHALSHAHSWRQCRRTPWLGVLGAYVQGEGCTGPLPRDRAPCHPYLPKTSLLCQPPLASAGSREMPGAHRSDLAALSHPSCVCVYLPVPSRSTLASSCGPESILHG